MQLVDSHCHLPLLAEGIGVDAALQNARNKNVEHMLCVAIDLASYPEVLNLAKQYDCISATVGVHPNATEIPEPTVTQLAQFAADQNVVAIGETGLDYFRETVNRTQQHQRFRNHIQAARQVNKPLVIHSREAKQDLISILQEEGAEAVGGVMHCFVDDIATAEKAMELNFYISFSGIVTFKNAAAVQNVARQIPLARMLIETDSPYLAPAPLRGKTNQPAYVGHIARYIAELKQIDVETVAATTTDNFFKIFSDL